MAEFPPQHAQAPYRAYLVRLWQDGPDLPWRAFTRDAETSEERRFATVEHLFLFLHRQTEGAGNDDVEERRRDRLSEQSSAPCVREVAEAAPEG